MSGDRVLILVPGVGTLALDVEAYRHGLAEGAQLAGPVIVETTGADEPLLDSEQLGAVLNLPPSWLESAGRDGRIPSIQAGRWRRFRRSDVERVLSANGKHA